MSIDHGAREVNSELEYTATYSWKTPHSSRSIPIGENGDFSQKMGFVETKVLTAAFVKNSRVQVIIDTIFPSADFWHVTEIEPARVVGEVEQVDLWSFSLSGTRFVPS